MNKLKAFLTILINARKNHMKIVRIREVVGHLQPLGHFKAIQDIVEEN